MQRISSALRCATACALLAASVAAGADAPTLRAPVLVPLPSAHGVYSAEISARSGASPLSIVAAVWAGPGDEERDVTRSRIIAFDTASGLRVWQRDFADECFTNDHSPQTAVALFANGDAAVMARAQRGIDSTLVRYTCFARLDGGDGHVVWSRTDEADLGDGREIRNVAIAVDAAGDVVATGSRDGHLRSTAFSGTDGEPRWTQEDPTARPAVALAAGLSDTVFVATDVAGAGDVVHRDVRALANGDGALRWQHTLCDRPGSQTALQPQADGSLAFATDCTADTANARVGRLDAASGDVVWQHDVANQGVRYGFDASGDPILVGALSIDGQARAIARYAAADGQQRWSVAGTLGGRQADDPNLSGTLNIGVGDGVVLAWELIGNVVSVGTFTSRLSRYAADDGHLLDRTDLATHALDDLGRTGVVQSLPGGDALLIGHTGYCDDGCWLWMARVGTGGATAWLQREAVSAPRPLLVHEASEGSAQPMIASSAGTLGVVMAGHAGDAKRYPLLAKVAQDDGRLLWSWRPAAAFPASGARVKGLRADAAGHIYVAASALSPAAQALQPVLAKIDAASGAPIWERFDTTASIDETLVRTLALDAAGAPFVLTTSRLQKISDADGGIAWSVPIPDAYDGEVVRLAIDAHGDALAATTFSTSAGAGVQALKFRGSDGALVWRHRWSATSTWATADLFTVLAAGDLVMTAGLGDRSVFTRLAGASGTTVWESAVAPVGPTLLDRGGQLVAATGNSADWQLTRIDLATGAARWTQVYPGTSGGGRGVTGMTLDGDGNLLVVGTIAAGFGTASVAIASGAMIWQSEPVTDGEPADIVQGFGGRAFIAADASTGDFYAAGTLFGVDGPFARTVFASGFDAGH